MNQQQAARTKGWGQILSFDILRDPEHWLGDFFSRRRAANELYLPVEPTA